MNSVIREGWEDLQLFKEWEKNGPYWCRSSSRLAIHLTFSFESFLCFAAILLPRESDQCAVTSSLRSCRSSVYHTKMEEFRFVPFPTAQKINFPACSPHSPFNAERQVGML